MILFNTTFIIDRRLTPMFNDWGNNIFIPAAVSSGLLCDPLFCKILPQDIEDEESESFAIQFKANTMDDAQSWADNEGASLIGDIQDGKEGLVLAFSTFMEIINK